MQCKGGGQEWYYHAPSANSHEVKQLVPPPSQIPGLSAWDVEAMERENGTNRRNQIKDSDSRYIQLAKQGGRKNLLSFNSSKFLSESEKAPKPYPRVDWFDHVPMSSEEEKKILAKHRWNPPEYMVYDAYREIEPGSKPDLKVDLGEALKERRNIQEKYAARGVPFHTDDKSVWRREYDTLHGKPKTSEIIKLPEIKQTRNFGKKEVEFSKLIQGGYGDDWLNNLTMDQKRKLKKWQKQVKASMPVTDSCNLSEYQQSISKKEPLRHKLKPINTPHYKSLSVKNNEETTKAPFKLSKFANVKSRLATKTSA